MPNFNKDDYYTPPSNNWQDDWWTRRNRQPSIGATGGAAVGAYLPSNYPTAPYQPNYGDPGQEEYARQWSEYQNQLNEYQRQVEQANRESETRYTQEWQNYQNQLNAYNQQVAEQERQQQMAQANYARQVREQQQAIEEQQRQQAIPPNQVAWAGTGVAGETPPTYTPPTLPTGYQRADVSNVAGTYATQGNVIAPTTPYQSPPTVDVGGALKNAFAFAGMQAGQPYGLIPTNPTYQGITGYQRATSYALPTDATQPGENLPSGYRRPVTAVPVASVTGGQVMGNQPVRKTNVPDWKRLVPESQPADYEAYENDVNARRAAGERALPPPRTNVTGWDKSRIPDTVVSDKFPHGQARDKAKLIANGIVEVDPKTGTGWFVVGAYKGLPAERFPNDIAWIQDQVKSGKWSLEWAKEYARLIGVKWEDVAKAVAPKVTAPTAPKATAPSGYPSSANYGQGGYTPYSYGGYSSPGATTPTTGNMPGWLMPWQKVRI